MPAHDSALIFNESALGLVRRHAQGAPAEEPSAEGSGRSSVPLPADAPGSPVAPYVPSSLPGDGAVLNIVGVHLYLERDDGRILLGLRHPDSAYAGATWHFLAGHCERESAVSCLVREAQEEAGLLIRPEDADLVHAVHLVEGADRPRVQLVFRARKWRGEPEILEPGKCTAWEWWEPGRLPPRTVPYAKAAVAGIVEGRFYTEMGWS